MGSEKTHAERTERQLREQAYHQAFAREHASEVDAPVPLDVIEPGPRRPWNCFWCTYDELLAQQPAGKRVFLPGCGFGNDAIRLAKLGAEVHASDISPELVAIARIRAERAGVPEIHFDAMPAEASGHPSGFFDLVYFNDILHHVDIPSVVNETRRILKPGGTIVANELYTHSTLQRVRDSRLVSKVIYPRMVRFIYGTDRPYITEDERKVDEKDLAHLLDILAPGARCRYFLMTSGRLVPQGWTSFARFDQRVLALSPRIGQVLAGRILIVGQVAAPAMES